MSILSAARNIVNKPFAELTPFDLQALKMAVLDYDYAQTKNSKTISIKQQAHLRAQTAGRQRTTIVVAPGDTAQVIGYDTNSILVLSPTNERYKLPYSRERILWEYTNEQDR